jgi:hypothetical protein
MRITITANKGNPNEKILLDYLEKNASDELVKKINSGNKTLNGCWQFIIGEAKNYLHSKNGAVSDDVVFGWAIHFFEEDSIKEGATPKVKAKVTASISEEDEEAIEEYNDDSEQPVKERKTKDKPNAKSKEEINKGYSQANLFDFL